MSQLIVCHTLYHFVHTTCRLSHSHAQLSRSYHNQGQLYSVPRVRCRSHSPSVAAGERHGQFSLSHDPGAALLPAVDGEVHKRGSRARPPVLIPSEMTYLNLQIQANPTARQSAGLALLLS